MAKDKALQVWKFTPSQATLLKEQARQHATDLAPFKALQAYAQNELLNSFRPELGIPEDAPLTVDLAALRFVERIESQIPDPQGPVEVIDPGKTPSE